MITVVGIGQPLRGDDSVGWQLVQALPDREGLHKVLIGDDMTRLLDVLQTDQAVILVDAVRSSSLPPGTVQRFDLAQEPDSENLRFSSHSLDPLQMLKLARRLGRSLPAQLVLFAIEGAEFGFSAELSEPVRNGWPLLLGAVENEIRALGVLGQ